MRIWWMLVLVLGVSMTACGPNGMGPGVTDAGPGDGGPDDPEPCNGLDDDGDSVVDEGCRCEAGEEQPCFVGDTALAGVGACRLGNQACVSDFEFGMWDVCVGSGAPSEEVCDGVDNDCDGETDEGCECAAGDTRVCGDEDASGTGMCTTGLEYCVDGAWGECLGAIDPTDEECDGFDDEDCDGLIDEGCECPEGMSRSCYGGPAGTEGVGMCTGGMQTCTAEGWGACEGVVTPSPERCSSELDEDCDGLVDCADPDCDALCCMPWEENVAVVPPDGEIFFLVDRSGSMQWPAVGTSESRWTALEGAMASVLPSLDDLDTGLMTFPELDGTSELLNCDVASGPDVPLMSMGSGTILGALASMGPRGGDTPTPAAFMEVQDYLASVATSRPRFVVLATDGLPEPNCGATVPATVTAISQLRADGVDTFVLGIVGPDSDGDTSGIPALQEGLNMMADAGGRARAGAIRYYEAVDGPALTTALERIVASAADCQFSLAADPPRGVASVRVYQDGALVPASGYDLTGRTLRFSGAYCDAIQSGSVSSIRVADDC